MSKYLESTGDILKGINSIFSSITIGKFLKWILTILIISSAVLFLYEKFFTSTFFYDKIDRKIEIIKEVKSIGHEDVVIIDLANKKLINVLDNLDSPESISFSPYLSTEILIKILGATILPFFIVLVTWKDADRTDSFLGALIILILFGLIALIIPVIYNVWINFVLIIILEILTFIPFIVKESKANISNEKLT